MNDKRKRFCDAYLANGCNATKAAIEAGYTEKAARGTASCLLKNPEVRDYIGAQNEAVHNAKIADAGELFEFWSAVMRGDEKETVVASNGKVVEVPASMQNRIRASELRGKALNLFTNTVNVTGSVPVVIRDDVEE